MYMMNEEFQQQTSETYLELPGPEMRWRVIDKTFSKIALNATDKIMLLGVFSFAKFPTGQEASGKLKKGNVRNDSEGMIL